jgi:large subunit ribosomal protein L4
MELSVLDIKGKKTSKKVKLNDAVFGIEPNDHAIYLDVKQYLANQRTGTHKAKERGEITGSRRKLRKQKGSGAARTGDIKNPILRGGGRIFGPRPRDYGFKLNKKVKQLARKSAISHKIKAKGLHILEDFNMESPKTKAYSEILNSLNVSEGRSLLILSKANENIFRSSNNIPGAEVSIVSELNTYDILKAKNLVLIESSVKEIESLLS